MDENYKLAKEAFVAGLQGTSAREVFLVFAIAPGGLWLYSELMLLLEVVGIRQLGAGNLNLAATILLEFAVTVVPTMMCTVRFHAKEFVRKHCRKEKVNQLLEKELPFLTNFRAQIMISTSHSEHPQSFVKKCYTFLRPIALVLVFGVARFLTVKGVNYQEHVSEYGVHWNFFFTLAGVYLVYSFLRVFGRWASSPVVAILIALGYQVYLSHYGGEEYILDAPRDNLMSQNREGILSLAGGCDHAFVISGLVWLSTFLSVRLVARPSRRMLNLSYLLWVMAESLTLIALYSGIQTVCMLPRVPLLFQGINHNQLFIFIVANLMTGGVNLSMHTINTSPVVASGVLLLYMLVVCVLASVLQHANVRIKL
ncbi:GWT1 protein [Phytophthora cactorum]|nr:GWT1 protein [Phytophthora cactorum]